ncbi:hypothetical protein O181_002828 [Austropuccinia psidii MF-1]|uniref:Uncharacterized protein n=1 Tax=Austropuccinia psidii MF-1 TaxID=1389203 RepID=A0A9Q3BD89_9BASI|nr:hypothetical protein [Austropuccinia psidii MF-1]
MRSTIFFLLLLFTYPSSCAGGKPVDGKLIEAYASVLTTPGEAFAKSNTRTDSVGTRQAKGVVNLHSYHDDGIDNHPIGDREEPSWDLLKSQVQQESKSPLGAPDAVEQLYVDSKQVSHTNENNHYERLQLAADRGQVALDREATTPGESLRQELH